jgi:hypothetical protein
MAKLHKLTFLHLIKLNLNELILKINKVNFNFKKLRCFILIFTVGSLHVKVIIF